MAGAILIIGKKTAMQRLGGPGVARINPAERVGLPLRNRLRRLQDEPRHVLGAGRGREGSGEGVVPAVGGQQPRHVDLDIVVRLLRPFLRGRYCHRRETSGFALPFASSSTATTARLPSAAACTRCATIA